MQHKRLVNRHRLTTPVLIIQDPNEGTVPSSQASDLEQTLSLPDTGMDMAALELLASQAEGLLCTSGPLVPEAPASPPKRSALERSAGWAQEAGSGPTSVFVPGSCLALPLQLHSGEKEHCTQDKPSQGLLGRKAAQQWEPPPRQIRAPGSSVVCECVARATLSSAPGNFQIR